MDPIEAHLNSAFEGRDPAEVDTYLDRLLNRSSELAKATGRTAILLVVLMVLNELTIRGLINKVSVSGVEFQEVGFLRVLAIALPLLISYNFYDLTNLGMQQSVVEDMCLGLARRSNSRLVESRLFEYIIPHAPSFTGDLPHILHAPSVTGDPPHILRRTKAAASISFFGDALKILLFTAIPLFIGRALVVNFHDYHGDILFWVSALISVLFILVAYTMLFAFGQVYGP